MEIKNENAVCLAGKLVNLKTVWQTKDMDICEGILEISRDSGTTDSIPILFDNTSGVIQNSTFVQVVGQLRSRDLPKADGKIKVQLYIYVKEIKPVAYGSFINKIELEGYICKQPALRTTPSGKQIADLLVACNYSKDKTAYLPVITWGREARKSGKYLVGTKVKITGRVQSRNYTKLINNTQEEYIAYELSANQIDCVDNILD